MREPSTRPAVGIITNHRSRRNLARVGTPRIVSPGVLEASPESHAELAETLALFRRRQIDLLIIDGGDGTVRDVLTAAAPIFDTLPTLAVVPSGKTNALALDLGVPADWNVARAIEAASDGARRTRSPIEVRRADAPDAPRRGFLLGVGGFVRATQLAQRTHGWGAFNGLAVGLSLGLAIGQTLFGGEGNVWQRGERLRIDAEDGPSLDRSFYLALASTLVNLPLGLKPFGQPRHGLKLLAIDAPPRALGRSIGPLLRGGDSAALEARGYRRIDSPHIALETESDFVLDGEAYRGGALLLSAGPTLDFVVP